MKSHINIATICLVASLCSCSALQVSQPQVSSASQAPTSTYSQHPENGEGRNTQKVKVGDIDGEIVGVRAKNSKFAKVQIGMGEKEVEDLIGTPNDSKRYLTGKAFIPFYFGADANRFETFYKKEGSLTYQGGGVFGSTGKLIRIKVDPAADGYAHDD